VITVLYVHHFGGFGGASRSLLEMVKAFPPQTVKPLLVTQKGRVADIFIQNSVDVIQTIGISSFDNTAYSYYRGWRWLVLLREFLYLPFTLKALLKARTRWRSVDLIHLNEATNLAAFVLCRVLFRCPIVIHVRSVQRGDTSSLRTRIVRWMLRRADAVIPIDETVSSSLPVKEGYEIVYNGFSVANKERHRKRFVSGNRYRMVVAMVGVLMQAKGVEDFLEAAKICRDKGLPIDFHIIGDSPRKTAGVRGWILKSLGLFDDLEPKVTAFIASHGLQDIVKRTGFVADLEQVYDQIDVLCFPSHLNATGRPVIEAAFFGIPSVVAMNPGKTDTLIPDVTGLRVDPKNPKALAAAFEYLVTNPHRLSEMGEAALRLADERFQIANTARRVLNIYQQLMAHPAAARSTTEAVHSK
jgi:glycosyltransferase involved in cell wall biosynthesis